MPEDKNPKKLRLYKFASEYNLSSDSMMEFLKGKGHSIKSHMALLNDEMLADIHSHYKKDIEKAENHYRKVNEFHKKRVEKSSESSDDEAVDVKDTEQDEIPEVKDEPVEETVEAIVESEQVVETTPEVVEEAVEETVKVIPDEQAETSEEVVVEKPAETVVPAEAIVKKPESSEGKIYKTKTELDMEKQKSGLTIVGKIDLDANKKKRRPKRQKPTDDKKPEIKPAEGTNAKPVSDEEAKKSKVKKKKLKVKKSPEGETSVETEEIDRKGKKKKRKKRPEVDKQAVDDAIKRTMLGLDTGPSADRASARKKKRKEKAEIEEHIQEQKELEKSILKVTEYISVSELANMMDVNVADVIAKCMSLGLMVSINQRLDVETLTVVADEFGFDIEIEEEYAAEAVIEEEEDEETLKPRPPVVTIMGHVDHGKTSLLDYIRKANVVAGEAGGITQHIGAYKVDLDNGKQIAFLDTPGHEAFTAMRARGASVTDIVILIVAADDAVMPQTIEAINHSLAAEVPIVVAINKVDKPGANVEKIKQQLADRNVLVEDWGGKYQVVEISAKMGTNIDILLDKLILEAEMLELKANPDRKAHGAVIETQLDKGRGITSTVLVQKGTLKIGDPFVAGVHHGRVRAMFDERNKKINEVGPSTPVLVLGFEGSPQAGDTFIVMESERAARELSNKRMQLKNEQDRRQVRMTTLDEIARQASQGGLKELPLIVKGDVDGSVEALADSLMKLSNEEVTVRVIHKGVGAISEGDVILAAASQAIIVGFHVRPHNNARKLAEKEQVDIRLYNVIYDTINEIRSALEGLLSPVISEKMVATVEVRDTFKVPKVGTVAGCYVTDGKISRNEKIRLFRDGIVIYEGELSQLRRFKDDVKEVDAGYECGLNIHNFNDIKVGDIIESYIMIETKKTLDT
ncbi:MAG: translation initiation factor IF-2 [Melioribacteraceae bacterium]|nr:translation initiation factor IF-2 [Melioribacteraceae bacterium]